MKKFNYKFTKQELEDFDFWIEDGNVIRNQDGSYSTQDAQFRNRLKDLDALKEYFYKEFLKEYENGGSVTDMTMIAKAIEYITGTGIERDSIVDKGWKYEFRFKGRKIVSSLHSKLIQDTIYSNKKSLIGRYEKGGNVSSIEKKVQEVNRLIELANEKGISVVDSSSTWQSPMKYKPIRYSNGVLYVEYDELDLYKYNRTGESNWVTQKDKVLKRDMQFDNPLNAIAKMYRKALKSEDIELKDGGDAGFDDTGTSMVMYHEKKGNFIVPKGQVYLWLYDVEGSADKLQKEEFDWVFYPNTSQNMAFQSGYIPPLEKIWTKKFKKEHKGSEHLLGVIKAYLLDDGKKLFIDMMSVNPTKKKKGIMSYMIKDLRDSFNLTQEQVEFSKLTDDGKKFVAKKTYADGGSIGFIPMDLEEDLMIISKWGGTNINGVIGFLNAMIDSGLTDSDLLINPSKNTRFQIEKAKEKKIQEIWNIIEPNYKGDLKGNMYYSTIKELVQRANRGDYILKRFKPFRKYQKDLYADGGWVLVEAHTGRTIREYKTESEARQMMYEYDGDSFVVEKSELEREKLRETYREPAPLNPATYIGMKDGGYVGLKVRRKNLRGGYNNYIITNYSDNVYLLKDLKNDLIISVKSKELKDYFEFIKDFGDGGDIPNKDKMFHLPLEMVVYVPSTQDVDKVISVDEMQNRVNEVKEYLASKFGGYSATDKLGGFVDSTGKLVNEDVVQVTSFSTKEAYEEHKEELIQQLSKWGQEWGQEAIGFEFEGDLMYVPQELQNENDIAEFKRGGFMYEVQKKGSPSNDMRETLFTAKNLTELKNKIIEKYGTSEGFIVRRRTEQGYFAPVKFEKGGAIYPDLSLQKADVVNDSIELNEFTIKKMKNTFNINGMENTKISRSVDAVNILRKLFSEDTMSAYEQAFVLYLNKNNKVIGYYHHSSGGVDGTIMDVQMISGMALKSLAKGVIIAHNHPSENTMPSDADKKISKKLKEALELFNIALLDSLILTENSYLSLADEGLI